MLDKVAAYLAQQIETKSMVRGAMIYPGIIGFMAVGTTIFLLTFVLPVQTRAASNTKRLSRRIIRRTSRARSTRIG